jgi:hypothetical protein
VKTGWTTKVHASGKRNFIVTNRSNGVVAIDLKKGEEVILYTGTRPATFNMTEASSDNNYNYWGLHK